MVERRKLVVPPQGVRQRAPVVETTAIPRAAESNYFASAAAKTNLKFISSGCPVLDAALGGGWVLGRVANIVGDKSAGKTLLAMEAMANFLRTYPDGWCRYAEAEAAFDEEYAEGLGIPIDRIILNEPGKPLETVEDWERDLKHHLNKFKGRPGLYIEDSLDALSDEAEEKREFGEGTYGGTKPKLIGQLFRQNIATLEQQEVCLIIVSQLRDKLNVTFGETKTRSGGRALDFYASQIVWLAEIEKMKRVMDKIERVVGIKVRAKVKKNKVGLPFREADYPILFGYGIDDLTACTEWLLSAGCESVLSELGLSKAGYKVRINSIRNKGGAEAQTMREALRKAVFAEWARIEHGFLPTSKKY